jgi:hypothetical protein
VWTDFDENLLCLPFTQSEAHAIAVAGVVVVATAVVVHVAKIVRVRRIRGRQRARLRPAGFTAPNP